MFCFMNTEILSKTEKIPTPSYLLCLPTRRFNFLPLRLFLRPRRLAVPSGDRRLILVNGLVYSAAVSASLCQRQAITEQIISPDNVIRPVLAHKSKRTGFHSHAHKETLQVHKFIQQKCNWGGFFCTGVLIISREKRKKNPQAPCLSSFLTPLHSSVFGVWLGAKTHQLHYGLGIYAFWFNQEETMRTHIFFNDFFCNLMEINRVLWKTIFPFLQIIAFYYG